MTRTPYVSKQQLSDCHSYKTNNYIYDQCNNKIPKHGGRKTANKITVCGGAKRMESESVTPPKCKIGRSKHQALGKNADIQRKTHCRIVKPTEMNNTLSPCDSVNVSKNMI